MRLKTIHARTMQEAMELVREQLGAEAIIVATHEDEGSRGVRVTAATDAEEDGFSTGERALSYEMLQLIGNALDDHGTPTELTDRILNAAATQPAPDPHLALASGLDATFGFQPLPDSGGGRPLMMIGPPGGGKTSAVAKLAARSIIAGRKISLITTDTVRARAVEQLEAYAARLGIAVNVAPDPVALIEAIESGSPDDLTVIDTMGVNPYSEDDMTKLMDFAGAIAVDPVLVLSAGRDVIEAMEIARAYAEVAPTRMLVTGLDMVRRLGSVLAAADAAGLAFSDVSPSPTIVNGLRPINPVSLARLLLPADGRYADNGDEGRTIAPASATRSRPPRHEAAGSPKRDAEDDELAAQETK